MLLSLRCLSLPLLSLMCLVAALLSLPCLAVALLSLPCQAVMPHSSSRTARPRFSACEFLRCFSACRFCRLSASRTVPQCAPLLFSRCLPRVDWKPETDRQNKSKYRRHHPITIFNHHILIINAFADDPTGNSGLTSPCPYSFTQEFRFRLHPFIAVCTNIH